MPANEMFTDWLKQQVDNLRNEYATLRNDGDAFSVWALSYIHELDSDDSVNASDTYVGQGDLGLDGYLVSQSDSTIYLIQSKYSEEPLSTTYTASQLESLAGAWSLLTETPPTHEFNERGTEISNALIDGASSDADIVFQYCITGRITETQEELLRTAIGNLQFDIAVDIWDLERLYELWISRETTADLNGTTIQIQLSSPETISIQEPPETPGIGISALVNLDAHSLGEVASQNDPNIYSANVRYHLGSNRINSGIRKALRDEDGRSSFWYHNNGLTIVADNFEIHADHVHITNPQIVNGCQTTKAFSLERHSIPSGSTSVLARVITLNGTQSEREGALVRISEFTNSQNPVKAEDLKSNDRVQMELQTHFRAVGWFYERKKKEWNTLSTAEQNAFGGRRVTNTEIAQSWRAFDQEPMASVQEKGDHFTDPAVYGEIFKTDRSPYDFLLAYELSTLWDRLLVRDAANRRNELYASFEVEIDTVHEDPLLSLILRAKRLWVMHASAISRLTLSSAYGFDIVERSPQLCEILWNSPAQLDPLLRVILGGFGNWSSSLDAQGMDIRTALKRSDEESVSEWSQAVANFIGLNFPGGGFSDQLPGLD